MGGSVGATGLTIVEALRRLALAGLLVLAALSVAPQPAAAEIPPGCTLAPVGLSARLTCNSSGVTVSCSGSYITFACTASGLCSGTVAGFASGSTVTVTSNSLACTSASTLTADAVARQASQAGMSAVQGHITTIRDQINRRLAGAAPPLGLAEEEAPAGMGLGYADDKAQPAAANPLRTKAPPPASAAAAGLSTWAQLFGDHEERSVTIAGFEGGRVARTGGLMGGADKLMTNAFMTSDALLVGLLAGTSAARTSEFDGSSLRLNGPSVGAYAIWMLGGFSTDASFKVDFFHIDQTAVDVGSARFGLTNTSIAFNVNRRFDVSGWWMEPTIGILDTRTIWNDAGHARGHSDSNAFRLQGGSRFGTVFAWGRTAVEASLAALVYDDIAITGGTVVTAVATNPQAVSDEGKLFGQLIGKLNIDCSQAIPGLTASLESELRGRSGVLGLAQRIGVHLAW